MKWNRFIFRRTILAAGLVWCAAVPTPVRASPHDVRVPLHDGKLHAPDLLAAVCREFHLPVAEIPGGNIDLTGLRGSAFVSAMNLAMGNGCRFDFDRDVLILRVDPQNLPIRLDHLKLALRVFTAEIAPQATALQTRRWGLFLPETFDPRRPLVVLIPGLDSEKECMSPLGELLNGAGYQVGYFAYPEDQPIEDSSQLFARRMTKLSEKFPGMKADVIAHSMGGLIARDYIEGSAYRGGVDRLILIGAPNGGSSWANFGVVLKAKEQFNEWRHDPDWSWTWSITSGLGEASRDLTPGSGFLIRLNSLPRRSGVRYTAIAGTNQPCNRISAGVLERVAETVPSRARNWWGFRDCDRALAQYANHLRMRTGQSDGPVKLASAKLSGIDDFVLLNADHCTLISPDHGHPPAAWNVIRDRLEH